MAVRTEKVVLSLEDRFSAETLRAAAAAKTLDKSLDGVNRTSSTTSRNLDANGKSARGTSQEIDKLSGRLRLFRDIGITLGPALAPLGGVGVAAVAGLAAQFGAATLAAGTALIAFQGVGDTLSALNDAALEPTAANLEKARVALAGLGPEAREFVTQMQELRPVFEGLSDAAGAGVFPGLSAAFAQFEAVAPRLEGVLTAIGDATGDVVNDFATGLSGSRGMEFLDFIRTEVPGALRELGATVGNVAAGLAEMWQAFTPLNNDFSGWLLEASRAFDDWASGLSQTEGFQDFIAYIRDNGPRVADAMGAIGNALVDIVTAAAPLGGPVLMALQAIAETISLLAGSPAGPAIMAAVTAMTLLSRATQAYGAIAATSWGMAAKGAQGAVAQFAAVKGAAVAGTAGLAGMSLAMVDLGESASSTGRAFESMSGIAGGALLGFAVAGPWGAAIGGGISLMTEMTGASRDLSASLKTADEALASMDPAALEASLADVNNEMNRQSGLTKALAVGMPVLGIAHKVFGDRSEEAARKQRALNVALATSEGETTGLAAAVYGARNAAARFTTASERQAAAMRDSRQAARGVANEFIDLSASADDAKTSLREWLRILEQQASALRDFRKNAQQAGEKGLRQGLIADLQELGPVGAMRMRQLANATDSEISRANKAWQAGQNEIRKYSSAVTGVPTSRSTKITADTGAALGAIMGLRNQLSAIPDETVRINVVRGATAGAALGAARKATGGPIYGPGTGTSDNVPIWASNGEHMWTAREVANAGGHGAVEAMRAAFRYAQGGPIGWNAAPSMASRAPVVNVAPSSFAGTVGLSDADVQRIADAVRVGAAAGVSGQVQSRDREVRNLMRGGR